MLHYFHNIDDQTATHSYLAMHVSLTAKYYSYTVIMYIVVASNLSFTYQLDCIFHSFYVAVKLKNTVLILYAVQHN